jgi:hypothetical protein
MTDEQEPAPSPPPSPPVKDTPPPWPSRWRNAARRFKTAIVDSSAGKSVIKRRKSEDADKHEPMH